MKVMLLVHGLSVGGAEAMVCHVARHLRGRGVDVEVACLGERGLLAEELSAAGIPLASYSRRPGIDKSLPLRLARRMRQGGFAVAHAHQRTALFYGLLAGLLNRTPLVYTEHGPLRDPVSVRKQRRFNRLLGWRLHRITAVSRALMQELVDREGLPASKIEIVPNAVDVARFAGTAGASSAEARLRNGLPPSGCIIGAVGRLDADKNYGLLLYVLERLRHRIPEPHLVVVGEGAERPSLEALARTLHLDGHVHFLGMQRGIERILPGFDVLCLPSLAEGIPLTLLEAMAAGVPTVSASVGGVPEAVRSEEEGLLVPGTPPDASRPLTERGLDYVGAFADAVERLMVDHDLRRHVVARAFERARDCFALDAICRRYEEVLTDAAARSRYP